MPYISPESKKLYAEDLAKLKATIDFYDITPGQLNYLMTSLCKMYIDRKGINYTHLNDVLGVFDGAGKEFYRRVVAPYEDKKIEENGDVY